MRHSPKWKISKKNKIFLPKNQHFIDSAKPRLKTARNKTDFFSGNKKFVNKLNWHWKFDFSVQSKASLCKVDLKYEKKLKHAIISHIFEPLERRFWVFGLRSIENDKSTWRYSEKLRNVRKCWKYFAKKRNKKTSLKRKWKTVEFPRHIIIYKRECNEPAVGQVGMKIDIRTHDNSVIDWRYSRDNRHHWPSPLTHDD